jgi:hypothetical protein
VVEVVQILVPDPVVWENPEVRGVEVQAVAVEVVAHLVRAILEVVVAAL